MTRLSDIQAAELPATRTDPVQLARRIAVIVPTLNEAAHIDACLRALLTGHPALAEIQVIVADGGSTDATRSIVEALSAEFANVSLLDNPARLQAAAVNAGAAAAHADRDILVRCDAHADYPENYVLTVADALLREGADSLVVPMDARGEGCFQKANAWVVDTPFGSGGSAHRGGRTSGEVDHGHHAAFRRSVFEQLGGYNETFSHNEDAEYDARLARSGGRIYLDATIRIGYYPRADLKGLWRQYFGYGRGRARNLLTNNGRPRLRQLVPVANFLLLLVSLCLLTVSDIGVIWPFLYLLGLLAVTGYVTIRHRSLCGLWGGLILAVMHNAWAMGFFAGTYQHKRELAA